MNKFIHNFVPYYSQWSDPYFNEKIIIQKIDPCEDPLWVNSGFSDQDQYRFWSKRLCGIACLESILHYANISRPARSILLEQALQYGAYKIEADKSVKGLIYHQFCMWIFDSFYLHADSHVNISIFDFLKKIGPKTLLMASVSSEIRKPYDQNERKGGHLVLIHGYDEKFVYFHNPSGIDPHMKNVKLEKNLFDNFFSNKGISVNF